MTNTICINRLAIGRSDLFFITGVRNTITIGIKANTMCIHRNALWGLLLVELVGYTIAIAVRKNGFGQHHVFWFAQFLVCIIQGIQPPQWFYGLGSEVDIYTDRGEVVR